MVNALVKFAKTLRWFFLDMGIGSLHGMFSTETRYRWRNKDGSIRQPPIWVKFSSLFYLCPSIACYFLIPGGRPWEFWLYVCVALDSFMSEGFFAGRSSRWHIADRITSYTCAFVTVMLKPLLCSVKWVNWFCCGFLIFVPASKFLVWARKAETYEKWAIYHFTWHFLSVAAIVALIVTEHFYLEPLPAR